MSVGPLTRKVIRAARGRGVTVLSHSQWGSRYRAVYASRRARTLNGEWGPFVIKADTLVQHITVTPTPPSTRTGWAAACRSVESIGQQRFKSGVSYNFLVHPTTGWVSVGQPLDSKGTHTVNDKGVPGYSYDQNRAARAIAVVGNERTELSAKAVEAIAQLSAAMVEAVALTPGYDYVPHSLFAWKACPEESTRSKMPTIRKRVAALLRGTSK